MKFLDPNGSVFRFLSRIGDLMLLNVLCIVCCLPIFTVGTAISAMYYVTLRMRRGQDSGILRDFFHAFQQNLKQGILIHLLFTVATLLLAFDLYILWELWQYELFYKILFVGIAILSLWFVGIWLFIYPLLAQFNNTIRGHFKDACFLSIKHRSYTLAIALVSLAPWIAGLYVSYLLEWLIIIYLIIGFSGTSYFLSRYFATIFNQYIPSEEP